MSIKKLHIKNFMSLQDVSITFKPLTVLVGPNASGKSNVLRGLKWLHFFLSKEKLPDKTTINNFFWANSAVKHHCMSFSLESECYAKETATLITYLLQLQNEKPHLKAEELTINDIQVIALQHGVGKIRDEDGGNNIDYASDTLALKSAGDYGNKPLTSRFAHFIKSWTFYDFMPEKMKEDRLDDEAPLRLDGHGAVMRPLLFSWHKQGKDNFQLVNKSLEQACKLNLSILQEQELGLAEGYKKTVPLVLASDGTLRLLAYYTLLNQDELPLFVAIEEPERNLHPAALIKVASLLEELAQKTQVVITTHSSQLLDCFSESALGDDLGVMLLSNVKGQGTKVLDLEEAKQDNAALQGWIADFGIGSAVFDSGLI